MCFWDTEHVKISDIADAKYRYFVRTNAENRQKAEETFGSLAEVSVGITDEFAFTTELMSEREFNEKIEKAGGYINRIRMMD
jgi:homoserine dehydrogenase